jgi:hypothetical protein
MSAEIWLGWFDMGTGERVTIVNLLPFASHLCSPCLLYLSLNVSTCTLAHMSKNSVPVGNYSPLSQHAHFLARPKRKCAQVYKNVLMAHASML